MFESIRLIDLERAAGASARQRADARRDSLRHARRRGAGADAAVLRRSARGSGLFRRAGLGRRRRSTAITHTGTHVDAPVSLRPHVRGAAGADHRPGAARVVLRAGRRDRRAAQGRRRIHHDRRSCKRRLAKIDYQLAPRDIVLLQTGADKRLGSPEYFAQPGLGREGTLWLVEQGVKVIGIDAYTLDRPFADMVADYRRTGDGRTSGRPTSPASRANTARSRSWRISTRSARPHGFYVSCLPVKIERASAGWCRAVGLGRRMTGMTGLHGLLFVPAAVSVGGAGQRNGA